MATKSIESDTRTQIVSRTITLNGLTDIMFDRYAGDNDTRLAWHEKIYLEPGSSRLVLPTANLFSFFTAQNTSSAPKVLRDSRKYKKTAQAIASFVVLSGLNDESYIPFQRNGEDIHVGEFGQDLDEKSGIFLHRSVARLEKGIPNPKERPVLPAPWSLTFKMQIFPNSQIKEDEIRGLCRDGGIAIGLGTFRGQYGKFEITRWD